MKNIIIVGSGIISQTLIYYLQQKPQFKDHSFIEISDHHFYPSCSVTSTATVALRNTQKGISELGDLIVNGYQSFKKFAEDEKPSGVEEVDHYFETQNKSEKFLKRYGQDSFFEKSYLVLWDEYSNWLKKKRVKTVETVNDIAISADGNILQTKSGKNYQYDYLFWCTNKVPFIESKKRPGSYLECSLELTESKILEIDGINIILRSRDQKILIGSTTEIANHLVADLMKLKKLHETAKTYLKNKMNLEIPEFKNFSIKTGLRSLGDRKPKVTRIHTNEWGVFDLNKNGYLLSHHLSQKLIEKLTLSLH